jgi:hypothetical protein
VPTRRVSGGRVVTATSGQGTNVCECDGCWLTPPTLRVRGCAAAAGAKIVLSSSCKSVFTSDLQISPFSAGKGLFFAGQSFQRYVLRFYSQIREAFASRSGIVETRGSVDAPVPLHPSVLRTTVGKSCNFSSNLIQKKKINNMLIVKICSVSLGSCVYLYLVEGS